MNNVKKCSGASADSGAWKKDLLSKKFLGTYFIIITVILFVGCGSNREEMTFKERQAEVSRAVADFMPNVATDTINGVTHNFIRNAEIKCKVKDVSRVSRQIEDLVSMAGGYVSNSNLSSTINERRSIQSKKDSIVEILNYETENNMLIRVPNKALDTVMRKITDLSTFVDLKRLKSDDVKMKLFANKLAAQRYKRFSGRLEKKADIKVYKLNTAADAEENLLEKETKADEKLIESYDLAEQVNYSTIKLELHQAESRAVEIRFIPPAIDPYQTPFFSKVGSAFLSGLDVLKSCVLFIIGNWSLWLILAGIYFVVRKFVLLLSR